MKKIVNKKVQTALLRGAVAVSGGMCTIITALFLSDVYGVISTLFIGAVIVCVINERIK